MIRAIVVDMDGTFLRDDKTYDREKFLELYHQMKELGVLFVVASGNQYWHLADYFPEIKQEICFIAENGACIVDHGEVVFEKPLATEIITRTLELLDTEHQLKDYRLVMSGKNAAYIRTAAPIEYQEKAHRFYQKLQEVADYRDVQDTIYKFALNFPRDKVEESVNVIEEILGDRILAVTSGHEAVDLIDPSVGKGAGIRYLMAKYQLSSEQIAVFGDNLNDYGMFKEVIYSYAMANSRVQLKEIAYEVIGDNNSQAVLKKVATLLSEERRKENVRIS